MKKILLPVIAVAVALSSTMAYAENRAKTFVITPFVGGYHYDGVQKIDPMPIYGLKAGYNFTNRLGLEGIYEAGVSASSFNKNDDVNFLNYRLEALYHMFPDNRFVPYLAVGYGGMRLEEFNRAINGGIFDYGVGAKYFLTDNVALRADLRNLVIDRGPTVYNYEYTLGLAFILGGAKPVPVAAQAPKAAEAVPAPPAPPATPAPVSSLSVSPATIVTGQSASLSWTSKDTSSCDIQPGIGSVQTSGSMSVTPATSSNYTLSCTGQGGSTSSSTILSVTPPAPKPVEPPLDSDKDGVPDSLDKCPDTPSGVKVDMDGCPVDSDKDGVPDYLDKCPSTPFGDKVDASGCTIPAEIPCQSIKLMIEFDTNKADVKSAYHDELKKVGDMLNKYPKATTVIEGHTDDVGAAAANMKLSERRASSVRKYIIDNFGISADRITAKGYGETNPVVTNKTVAGRKENRRVNAILSCGNN